MPALKNVYGSFGKTDEERGWCLAARDESPDGLSQAATGGCIEREDRWIGRGRGVGHHALGELVHRLVEEEQDVLSVVLDLT